MLTLYAWIVEDWRFLSALDDDVDNPHKYQHLNGVFLNRWCLIFFYKKVGLSQDRSSSWTWLNADWLNAVHVWATECLKSYLFKLTKGGHFVTWPCVTEGEKGLARSHASSLLKEWWIYTLEYCIILAFPFVALNMCNAFCLPLPDGKQHPFPSAMFITISSGKHTSSHVLCY